MKSIACGLGLLAACAAPPSTSEVRDEIIGGTTAPDDDAVVWLVSYPPDRSVLLSCTATVIAPDVLLTAAHCVDAPNHPGYLFGAFLGADASAFPLLVDLEPHLVPVSAVYAHPDYVTTAPFHADLGVAILEDDVTIAPLPLRRAPITAAMVGDEARIVGYGQATLGVSSSTRRQAVTELAGIDTGDTIRVGDAAHRTCLGDSGGPALLDDGDGEQVIGVDSYADNGNCDQAAHFRRVDQYLDFIDEYTGYVEPGADAGVPDPDADEGDDDPGATDGGGCAAGGGGGGLIVALAALGLAWRRRG
jgi:secreted trypsin-like serine protease